MDEFKSVINETFDFESRYLLMLITLLTFLDYRSFDARNKIRLDKMIKSNKKSELQIETLKREINQ